MIFASVAGRIFLQECRVGHCLQGGQVGQIELAQAGAEFANRGGFEATLSRSCHREWELLRGEEQKHQHSPESAHTLFGA